MRTAVFSTKPYDEQFFREANEQEHQLVFFEPRLTPAASSLARGFPCVCAFVNDILDAETLRDLGQHGLRLVALRCAGFNNVDLAAAEANQIIVARVPAYSPHAVAEHTIALMLSLNRQLHRAFQRVREGNFSLQGLLGFDLRGRRVGVVGTGRIGEVVCRILRGFECQVIAHDQIINERCQAMGVRYVHLDEIYRSSDIITFHCPLVPETHHLVNVMAIEKMKRGVMLVNTSRGGIFDTSAVIEGLKSGQIGSLGIDVYEEEADLFFEDLSNEMIRDDVFARLLTFPNVLVTGHQAFFTADAMQQIATTTLSNIDEFERTGRCTNAVVQQAVVRST